MADLRFVRPNRLRKEAYRRRRWIAGVGLSSSAALLFLQPLLCLPVLFAMGFLWNRQERLLKGAIGEDRALGTPHPLPGALVDLSDEYVVFNQVGIPNRNGRPYEADFVVVGPNGIFVIEVKYYRGLIQGRQNGSAWTRYQPGSRKGAPISNPVTQVRRSMRALAAYLVEQGSRAWLEPIVVFTHPLSRISIDSDSVPVLALHELAAHVSAHRPRHPVINQVAVIQALRKLLDLNGSISTSAAQSLRVGRPVPIAHFMQDHVTNRVQSFMKYDLRAALRRERRLGPPSSSGVPGSTGLNPPFRRRSRRIGVRRFMRHIPPGRRTRRRLRVVERQIEWLEETANSDVSGARMDHQIDGEGEQ